MVRERAQEYQSSEVTISPLYCFAEALFLDNSSASFGTDTLYLVSLYSDSAFGGVFVYLNLVLSIYPRSYNRGLGPPNVKEYTADEENGSKS